jgi:hypothetical protein
MTRREAVLSAGAVFVVAVAVRAWAATQITFPRPEDVAYYVGVARNLIEGHGLTTDAIWSFGTPPLAFPRAAFEVWLPLPSLFAAIPMALFGTTYAAAQLSSILTGSVVAVLAWRLAADVASARGFTPGRARTLALGAGLTAAVYLPLVLASVQPDSTMPFAAFVLAACLLITRLQRAATMRGLLGLGALIGLAALTRNEAIWLALAWAILASGIAVRSAPEARFAGRLRAWVGLILPSAAVAIVVFAPWAVRDWIEYGSLFPGQTLTNALSLDGRDIFAWQNPPTVARYLGAGLGKLLELRWAGTVHNIVSVLLFLGVPLSVLGLLGLPGIVRQPRPPGSRASASSVINPQASPATHTEEPRADGAPRTSDARPTDEARPAVDPLRVLLLFSAITFAVASLVFPVSTTWGTFLHAAGAIHVLLVISALLVLDRAIVWVGARRGWTNPVAWLGPAFAIAGCLLFSAVILPADGRDAHNASERYAALAAAFSQPGSELDLAAEPGPVITDFPIWFAEATRHHALALPNEPPESILDLARSFDPPARLLVVDAGNDGVWPAAIIDGAPGSECFVPIELPDLPDHPGALDTVLAFRIRACNR